ncbi:MAG: oligosaccharide flippase family protein [Mangrovibacterium sp.]
MKRKFFTNLLLLLGLNLLIKPFWILGIDRTVQNLVGAEDYGTYFALFNFSVVLNMLLDLGITNFNNRAIAQHHQLLNKYLSFLVSLKFVLAGFYTLVCLLIAWLVGYNDRQMYLLYFLIFNQILISVTYYLRSNISGLHHFKTDSVLSVLDRSLMIIFCSILLFTNWTGQRITIEWFVYLQTLAYVLVAAVSLLYVLKYSGRFKLRFNFRIYKSFLRQSLPFALLVLLHSVYSRIDSVLIERLLPGTGDVQAGIYAQAFRLSDAASMFALMFAGLLLPMFSRMLKQKEDVSQMLLFAFELIMVPTLIAVSVSAFYADTIMAALYHNHVAESALLLTPLMIGFAGIASNYIFGTLLTANGNLKSLNLIAFSFMALNVAVNSMLIPRYGALAASRVAMCTQVGIALAQIVLAWRQFKLQINYLVILKLTGFLLFLLLAGRVSRFTEKPLWGMVLMAGAGLTYAVAVKLVDVRSLLALLKREQA